MVSAPQKKGHPLRSAPACERQSRLKTKELLLHLGCFAVRQSAAGFINRSGINSSVPYLYERNLSIDVYNVGDTIRHAIRAQDAVGFRGGTIFEIAEDGE